MVAPQDAGIEGDRVVEAAIRSEGPRGSQDMQVIVNRETQTLTADFKKNMVL